MGMLDYIICEYPLPDNPPKELSGFQTKSLSRSFDHYKIDKDGQLLISNNNIWTEEEQLGNKKHDFDWVPVNTSEKIIFYTSYEKMWYQYIALFNKGKLVSLERDLSRNVSNI